MILSRFRLIFPVDEKEMLHQQQELHHNPELALEIGPKELVPLNSGPELNNGYAPQLDEGSGGGDRAIALDTTKGSIALCKGRRHYCIIIWNKCICTSILCILITICIALIMVLLSHRIQDQREALIQGNSNRTTATNNYCLTEGCLRTAVALLDAMDRTIDPCVDFYQYACGNWIKSHPIPTDRTSVSTFELMSDDLERILKRLLDQPINMSIDNEAISKAKTIYRSCMNTERIRSIGDTPLRQLLDSFGDWPILVDNWRPTTYPIEVILGRIRRFYNEAVMFEHWVGPDDKNSSVNVIQLDQITLSLPSREYYTNLGSKMVLNAYRDYILNISLILGANRTVADEDITNLIEFERQLAQIVLPEGDRHDTSTLYNRMSLNYLQASIPYFDWNLYFKATMPLGFEANEPIVVYSVNYFREFGKIFRDTDRRTLQNFILWRLLMTMVPHMLDDYERARMEFRRVLEGILTYSNRSTHCVDWTNKKFGLAVGALFIRENFSLESKKIALDMIHKIRESFKHVLRQNTWMDEETKQFATGKIDAMNERIGYPPIVTNQTALNQEYHNIKVDEQNYIQNVFNVLENEAGKNLIKLRKPVDKDQWSTEPAVVNAFYNPNKNDIVFPAGILQPFFYSKNYPKSLNYGGIGVVIGHEITHGFDDKGRQFDKNGNLKQWWNEATIEAFRARAECITEQYSRYVVDEIGMKIDGRMTQGENIADNGGLKQAFLAYKWAVQVDGDEKLLPGVNLTHDQLFFLNYAQIWCGSIRPQEALNKLRTSVHSPGPVRVRGPLSNSKDFAIAYNCPLHTPMNPIEKCNVW